MKKILRNWNRLAIALRIPFMRQATDKQKATPSPIPHPYPDLTVLDTKVADAEAARDLVVSLEAQLKVARAAQSAKADIASEELEHNAAHVEGDTKGEPALEIAAGFEVAGVPAAVGPMTQPLDLTVSMNDNAGSLDWQCHPVEGAGSMETQTTPNPLDATTWKSHPVVTQSSGTLTGLPSGVRHYVRTRAIGPLGPGPWSGEANKMVP